MPDSMTAMRNVRARMLRWLFRQLYGPLLFLHEPAGNILFGPAWARRRSRLLALAAGEGTLLDLGCGSGILLAEADCRGGHNIGIDLSRSAVSVAGRRNVRALNADARRLPLPDACVNRIVCSYPGQWIVEPASWDEVARVLTPSGTATVLLGGTIERGAGATLRSRLITIVYGNNTSDAAMSAATSMGNRHVHGRVRLIHDRWGTAVYWTGQKGQLDV